MTEYICESNMNPHYDRNGNKLVEIVRCRDCIHYKPFRTYSHGMINRCHDENGNTHRRDKDDFCSRGERKDA